jgi:hypothetical protein
VTRSYDQIYEAAIAQRRQMIDEDRDPKDGVFNCTKEEYLVILDTPPHTRYELSAARHRICGLPIEVLGTLAYNDSISNPLLRKMPKS